MWSGAASFIPTSRCATRGLIVSSAFILWGIDQLLPSGGVATTLGDVVITLYVLDLGWVMIDRLKKSNHTEKKR